MAPRDLFKNYAPTLDSPAEYATVVTPDDSADISETSRCLYIGVAGDVTVRMKGQTTTTTFVSVPIGIIPIRVDRVMATGTTASSIVALS